MTKTGRLALGGGGGGGGDAMSGSRGMPLHTVCIPARSAYGGEYAKVNRPLGNLIRSAHVGVPSKASPGQHREVSTARATPLGCQD